MGNKLFFQLWNPTGMINQVMSIELAIGLAHETNKEMTVHYLSNSGDGLFNFNKVPIYTPSRFSNPQRQSFINQNQFPHLTDLLEWNKEMILIDEKIERFPDEDGVIDDMMTNCYYSNENKITNDELSFAEGRQRINVIDNVHIKRTLGWYSRFFYNRSSSLDKTLSLVKFKDPYQEFAKIVSDSLGDFVGGHLRLSDHVKMFNTTSSMFENGLTQLEKYNLPIVLCTDEPTHLMVKERQNRFILLDKYIIENFAEEFNKLPFQDEVVFGLVCNLIMCNSTYFIGTSGSTYTGYIQRLRNQSNLNETWDFWDKPVDMSSGPYSWNNYDLENGKKMWWREWSESKLNL